jgi:uncharacterized protein YndB with AHSA1/START domain
MVAPNRARSWLHLTRDVPASPSRVFRALTDPDDLTAWWGPHGFTTSDVALDLHVGGSYQFVMQSPEGERFHLVGEFREIAPPERLVYTFRWDPPDPDDVETVVTLSLGDHAGVTRLRLDQGPFATEPRLGLHEHGWSESIERLVQLLSPGSTTR